MRRRGRLGGEERRTEKNKAFDLLDALSRSGGLVIECSTVHSVLCVVHQFARSLVSTVIEGDINPIDKYERTAAIVASAVHGVSVEEVLRDEPGGALARVREQSPQLFGEDAA